MLDKDVKTIIQQLSEINEKLNRLWKGVSESKMLFAKDIAEDLKININSANKLLDSEDFPSIKNCGRKKIDSLAFQDWKRNPNQYKVERRTK